MNRSCQYHYFAIVFVIKFYTTMKFESREGILVAKIEVREYGERKYKNEMEQVRSYFLLLTSKG